MSMRMRIATLAVALAVVSALPVHAQLRFPRPSPKASVLQTIGTTDVTISYSRPGVKGRTIWGDLVPYDAPWRTGANEATTITAAGDIMIEGQKLAAGTYALLTIPGKDEWTVVVNKDKELWGSNEYKAEQDVFRVKVKPRAAEHTEWMAFEFENLKSASGELVLRWEKLALPIRIETDDVAEVLAGVDAALAAAKPDDWRTAYNAANFCFNEGVELEKAAKWADKSVAVQGNYYNLSLVAKMKAKAGNTKEAVAVAEKAIKAGKESKDKVDTSGTEKLLAQWTAK
jgi:tetratricopeptide (TPR) repeat protein